MAKRTGIKNRPTRAHPACRERAVRCRAAPCGSAPRLFPPAGVAIPVRVALRPSRPPLGRPAMVTRPADAAYRGCGPIIPDAGISRRNDQSAACSCRGPLYCRKSGEPISKLFRRPPYSRFDSKDLRSTGGPPTEPGGSDWRPSSRAKIFSVGRHSLDPCRKSISGRSVHARRPPASCAASLRRTRAPFRAVLACRPTAGCFAFDRFASD